MIHCVSIPKLLADVFMVYELLLTSASKLIVEIINSLKREKRLKKYYVDLLISQQLQVLDLSRETDEIGYPLRLASIRCVVCVTKYYWA